MNQEAYNQSVRNSDGIWINTDTFREEAIAFKKNKYYCPDPWGSFAWKEYWLEQKKRCVEGYTSGGVKITGHHYFYLNFTEMDLVEHNSSGKVIKKKKDFPHFWDGDYNFFWSKEIAKFGMSLQDYINLGLHVQIDVDYLDGGYHILVGKSRRKGYSYKNAAIIANTYNTVQNSTSIIGAYDKKYLYPEGTMNMSTKVLNFLNKNTGWAKKREYVDKVDHRRASFKKIDERGFEFEEGYLSQIIALTFADNPDAARGKDAVEILMEEGGKFPNLQASVMATDDTVRAGRFLTGQMTIFGTSGDVDGDSSDLANLFYNPKPFRLLPFINIWDEDAENSTCSFFHPINWNMEGFYDQQGNSDIEKAKNFELAHRAMMIKEATNSTALQQRLQENPLSPSEAFLNISLNNFPIAELRQRLNKVRRENLNITTGQPGYLIKENGKITFKPDLEGILEPIYDYKPKTKNLDGCVVIYEAFIPGTKKGVYKVGYDPYRQDVSKSSTSLGSVYVYKTIGEGHYTKNILVAEYVGRPANMDIFNRNVMLLTEYYNTEVMYENEVTSVKSFFEKNKKLDLLAAQPDNLISTIIKNSKVERVYGMHMVDKIKEAGEKYINSWLLSVRDISEDGREILQLETICSIGLLEELILYNRKGNFDRVMSLMMVLFQVEAEDIKSSKIERSEYMRKMEEDLKNLMPNLFIKR